jgi:hypothetical protein
MQLSDDAERRVREVLTPPNDAARTPVKLQVSADV